MSYFLRRLSHSVKNPLIRAIVTATAGSSFLYANGDTNYRIIPLYSYKVSPVPSFDLLKAASGVVEDGSKPCGCLGKGTIAKAVAKVGVTLQDGRTFEGTVVNADLHSDVAIVKINSTSPLLAVKFGSSSRLRPGEWVLAIGCPLSLQNTVTAGIDMGIGTHGDYLQTNCAVNMLNPGGPLVNIHGEVAMKSVAVDGLSFAVPIDLVCRIVEHFKKSRRVVRPWLGLKMIDLSEMIIVQLKQRDSSFPNVRKGILVSMHLLGRPGDRAGFRPGDVVIQFDGKLVRSIKEFLTRHLLGRPGDRAGFRPGDVVIQFDGKLVRSIKEVVEIMEDRVSVPLKVLVKRAGEEVVTLTIIPEEFMPYL